MSDVAFSQVPAADAAAVLDPHWVEMRGPALLTHAYLPPAMPGAHPRWSKWVAVGLVAVFVGATAAGVCLTYGPQPFGH